MDCDDIFKLDLSLEKLSGIAIAIGLWESPDVKKKIENNFNGGNTFHDNLDADNQWTASGQKVINYIFGKLNSLKLNEKLLSKIKILVVKIGQKICYWKKYVTSNLRLDERLANNICWTSCGDIDEIKILQEFWLKDPNFPGSQCKCFVNKSLYCLVSRYAQEGFVVRNFQQMTSIILSFLPALYKKQKWTPYGVIATWLCFCTSEKKGAGIKLFRNFNVPPDCIPASQLFSICITNGFSYGAKYFWNRVKADEKSRLVMEAARNCLNWRTNERNNWHNTATVEYKKETMTKMLIFLINEMTEIQRIQFVTQNFVSLFQLFLSVWPYQELCEKLLIRMWDYIPNHHKTLLDLSFNSTSSTAYLYFIDNNFFRKILQLVLQKVPKELKIEFFMGNDYRNLKSSYRTFKRNADLNLILNDPDLKKCRQQLIDFGIMYFKDLVGKGDYERINEFIRILEFSNEEKKLLKLPMNKLTVFVFQGQIKLADEHLQWLLDSDEERTPLKKKFDPVEVCSLFISAHKFTEVDEFLLWRFDSEEERRNVKKSLGNEEFLRNKIFEVWCSKSPSEEIDVLSEKCSELLYCFLESEEEVEEFKRTKLIKNELFIQKYWENLFYDNSFGNLEEFLEFCSLTEDDIEGMKEKIENNVNRWIDTFALEKGEFLMVDKLLRWVYADNKDERRDVIKNYVSSPRGCLLCIKIFKKHKERAPTKILKFYNSWIKPSFDFAKMRTYLSCFDESGASENILRCVKNLWGERELGRRVNKSNLSNYITFETFCTHSKVDRNYCGRCERYNRYAEEEEEEQEEEQSENDNGNSSDDSSDE